MDIRRWFTRGYLTADQRGLAVGRIALATVLLIDLARRAAEMRLWYTNEGLLPNHTVLWSPPFEFSFSFFYCASWLHEAALGFFACLLAYLMLLFGIRTRLAQVLSVLCVLSLHARVLFTQSGGDIVLVELCIWTAFLPSGSRYSLDSWRERARARAATGDAPAAAQASPALASVAAEDPSLVSLATLAITLQLAVIYLFNALQKTGPAWREGTVVHYMLHQDQIVTAFGVWMRPRLTPGASQLFTYMALAIESILPLAILSPWPRPWTRRLAILLILSLHGGFALCMNLGVFVPAMLAFTPHLVARADWDRLETAFRRLMKQFAPAAIAVLNGLSHLCDWLRVRAPNPPSGSPGLRVLREITVAFLILIAGEQVVFDNSLATHVDQSSQPRWMLAAATYLQFFQSWSMYAPDAPMTDTNIYVDAVTKDGRHVDPFSAIASPHQPNPGPHIPPRLGQSLLMSNYVLRIPYRSDYFPALRDWILMYPKRTGRSADQIEAFKVFQVTDESPPPGELEPRHTTTQLLFKYPE